MMKSMKRTKIFIRFAALAATVTMVACTEEEPVTEALTITGTIESPITKTALDGPDAGGVYKTVWNADDAIAIFSGESVSTKFTEQKLLSGAGTNTGQFSATGVTSNDMLAIYPASIAVSRNGTLATINLPEVQKYVEGNIPENAYPMYGRYNNGTLKFVNVCSVLKIPMYGDVTVKSITFSPNSDHIKVSGKAVIDWSERVMTMYSPSYSSTKLDCGEGVKLTDTATDFHMVVPPSRYVDGFSLSISTDKGIVVKTIKSTIILDRSVLYPIEEFECKIKENDDNIAFEDARFKAYIVANFDKDNDGEISYEEALAVTAINVASDDITSLTGIEHMTNLESLKCVGSHVWIGNGEYSDKGTLECLDLQKNVNLRELDCSYNNKIESLDLSKNPLLTNVACDGIHLQTLDISNNNSLEYLSVETSQLTSLNVRNAPKLKYLSVEENQMSSIDVSGNPSLQTLKCGANNLTSINVSSNHSLVNLRLSRNEITELDLSNNTLLEDLTCYGNKISKLNLGDKPKLKDLNVITNLLSSLDLSHCPELERLDANHNRLTSLELNCCPKLSSVAFNLNQISTLDISKLECLKALYCNSSLKKLYVYEGQIDGLEKKSIPSSTEIIVVSNPEEWAGKEFWHKSLGMKFTATWCGFCPTMATSFKKAIESYPDKIELINLHPTSSDLRFNGTSSLMDIFNISGFPTGIIDYRKEINNYDSDYTAQLIVSSAKETESNYPTKTGISFSSSMSGNTLNLDVKLYIKEKGDYKVTAVLLEDNIISYQSDGGDNYNHSSIARMAFSDISGDAFTTTANNKTVNKSYSVTLPSSYNKDNLRILVYVLRQYGSQEIIRTADYGDYYVDNATSAAIGTTKDLIFADGSSKGDNEDTKDGGEITLK